MPVLKWIFGFCALILSCFLFTACQNDDPKKLVLYTSLIERDMHAFLDVFHAAHPDIHVTFFRSDTTDLISKLDAEFLAENPKADLLLISDDIVMARLRDQGRLLPLPHMDISAFPQDSYDTSRTYFGTILQGTGLLCHSDFKHAHTQTLHFHDLTRPDFHHALVMPSPLFSGSASFNLSILANHKDFGWPFWEAVFANKPLFVKGNGAILDTVTKKGRMCGLILDCLALPAIEDGAGLTFHYFQEGVPIIREPIAILKHTHKKEAAEIFVTFILSKQGQQTLSNLGYRPLHTHVKPKPMYDKIPLPHILDYNPQAILARLESDREIFARKTG